MGERDAKQSADHRAANVEKIRRTPVREPQTANEHECVKLIPELEQLYIKGDVTIRVLRHVRTALDLSLAKREIGNERQCLPVGHAKQKRGRRPKAPKPSTEQFRRPNRTEPLPSPPVSDPDTPKVTREYQIHCWKHLWPNVWCFSWVEPTRATEESFARRVIENDIEGDASMILCEFPESHAHILPIEGEIRKCWFAKNLRVKASVLPDYDSKTWNRLSKILELTKPTDGEQK